MSIETIMPVAPSIQDWNAMRAEVDAACWGIVGRLVNRPTARDEDRPEPKKTRAKKTGRAA